MTTSLAEQTLVREERTVENTLILASLIWIFLGRMINLKCAEIISSNAQVLFASAYVLTAVNRFLLIVEKMKRRNYEICQVRNCI